MCGQRPRILVPMPHSVRLSHITNEERPGDATLGDLCNTSGQPQANAKAAFSQWTKAGMPASKLLLGLATYGYVSKSKKKKLSGSSASPLAPGAHPRSHRSTSE
jgi:chitinase